MNCTWISDDQRAFARTHTNKKRCVLIINLYWQWGNFPEGWCPIWLSCWQCGPNCHITCPKSRWFLEEEFLACGYQSLSITWTVCLLSLGKKVTIHQLTTMLATSRNVLFPGYNHLLTIDADDPSLVGARVIISVGSSAPMVSRRLWPGNRACLEVASMVVSWWVVAFLCSARSLYIISKKMHIIYVHMTISIICGWVVMALNAL